MLPVKTFTMSIQGCSQGVFFTAEFQHVNCMIVRIWEVKRVVCYARAETFAEAVVSVASMVATYELLLCVEQCV